jgi:lauroyl/myristoyl acyltransferase
MAAWSIGYYGASLSVIKGNRFEQRLAERIRKRFGGRMIFARPTKGRAIVCELQERGPMVIYIDKFIRNRVNAPAFGRPLKPEGNIAYVVRLAEMTGARQFFPNYIAHGSGHHCRAATGALR